MHSDWEEDHMNKIELIYTTLNGVPIPHEGFCLRKIENVYWGKGVNGEIVFGLDCANTKVMPIIQSTKHLILYLNTIFDINDGDTTQSKPMSMLVLKTPNEKYVDIFIRLTTTFSCESTEEGLLAYFLDLKDLFSNERKTSSQELQGLYGELISMYIMQNRYRENIARFYQVEEKRKFDFSISDIKKIEVKTTLKSDRIHHFLQEQLNTQRYDIRVLSLMLLKDDKGMSLKQLIDACKSLFSDNLHLILHIEMLVKNISEDDLESIRYNYAYAQDHFRIFDAKSIPRLHEKTDDGVFNVEYDCSLDGVQECSIDNFAQWLKEV